MAIALLAVVLGSRVPVADAIVCAVLFIWLCVALVMTFAARMATMAQVAVLGLGGSILIGLLIAWATAKGVR